MIEPADAVVANASRITGAASAVSSRPSKGGNYTAVTVVIEAHSRQQLDAIYLDLNRSPHILMTL